VAAVQGVAAAEGRLRCQHSADPLPVKPAADILPGRQEQAFLGFHQGQMLRMGQRKQLSGLVRGLAQRLFAQHVLAVVQAVQDLPVVDKRRGGDIDGIHSGIVIHLFVGFDGFHMGFPGVILHLLRIPAGEHGHFCVVRILHSVQKTVADLAWSQYRVSQHLHHLYCQYTIPDQIPAPQASGML